MCEGGLCVHGQHVYLFHECTAYPVWGHELSNTPVHRSCGGHLTLCVCVCGGGGGGGGGVGGCVCMCACVCCVCVWYACMCVGVGAYSSGE